MSRTTLRLGDRRYLRVYHDTREWCDFYDDDALFGAWVKLALSADSAWPQAAELPRSVSDEMYRRFVEEGEVWPEDDDRPYLYRMRHVDDYRKEASRQGQADRFTGWHLAGKHKHGRVDGCPMCESDEAP